MMFPFSLSTQVYTPTKVNVRYLFLPMRYGPVIPLDSFNKYIRPLLEDSEIQISVSITKRIDCGERSFNVTPSNGVPEK